MSVDRPTNTQPDDPGRVHLTIQRQLFIGRDEQFTDREGYVSRTTDRFSLGQGERAVVTWRANGEERQFLIEGPGEQA